MARSLPHTGLSGRYSRADNAAANPLLSQFQARERLDALLSNAAQRCYGYRSGFFHLAVPPLLNKSILPHLLYFVTPRFGNLISYLGLVQK